MECNKFTTKSKQRSRGHKIVLNSVKLQNQYHGSTGSHKNEIKNLHKTFFKLIQIMLKHGHLKTEKNKLSERHIKCLRNKDEKTEGLELKIIFSEKLKLKISQEKMEGSNYNSVAK